MMWLNTILIFMHDMDFNSLFFYVCFQTGSTNFIDMSLFHQCKLLKRLPVPVQACVNGTI